MGSITLGDLLRQDGAVALLLIGAALGFIAGRFFRGKEKAAVVSEAVPVSVQPPCREKNSAVIAAITSAVIRYRNETQSVA